MPDQHDHDLALSQFWNELTQTGDSSTSIDAEAAALIHRLHESASAPLPGSARERVWRGLLDTYESPVPDKEPPMHASVDVIRPGPNGWIRPLQPIPFEERPRLANRRIAIAVAAILVIALVGGIAGGLIQDRLGGDDPRPGPAILAPGTPEPIGDKLLEITLPADAIPPDGFDTGGLGVFVISPGSRSTWERTCCAGPLIEHVVAGAYTVQAEAAIDVIRADGSTETVPAGTDVTLGPGDSLVSRNEVVVEAVNGGSEPVVLINFVMVEDPDGEFGGHQLSGWRAGGNHVKEPIALQPAATTLRLSTATVTNGDTIAAVESGYQFVVTTTEDAYTAQISDGTTELFGPEGEPIDVYVLSLEQATAGEGSTPSAQNDELLVEIPARKDVLPAGESLEVSMANVTVPVGTFQQSPDAATLNPGVLAVYVVAGQVRVVSDEPMQLFRGQGAGSAEEIAAGTEITLGPGDALLTHKSPGEIWTNDGPEQVQLITMEIFAGVPVASTLPFGWVSTDTGWDSAAIEAWPGDQSLLVRLRRVTAPVESILPVPADAIVQLARAESGSSIGKQSDGSIMFVGAAGMGTALIMTLEVIDESATPVP